MNQKGFANIVLIIVVVIIIAVGVGYWVFTNQPAPQPITKDTNQVSASAPSTTTTQQKVSDVPTNKTPVSKPGWITTTNQQLGMRFEHPADASISSVEERKTTDGTTINELVVTPTGVDPTRVHFFSTSASLDSAKNIKIYGFTKVKNTEFNNTMINGNAGIRRVDHYLNNDCTAELTVVEKGGAVYGFHITQCPTHPQDYDQLRRDIVNSLELL